MVHYWPLIYLVGGFCALLYHISCTCIYMYLTELMPTCTCTLYWRYTLYIYVHVGTYMYMHKSYAQVLHWHVHVHMYIGHRSSLAQCGAQCRLSVERRRHPVSKYSRLLLWHVHLLGMYMYMYTCRCARFWGEEIELIYTSFAGDIIPHCLR